MGTGRRLIVLLLALTLIGVPAAVLRVACVGASCRSTAAEASTPAPFCSLPADLRSLIDAGTYENRSPDAMAVTGSTPVVSVVGNGMKVPWPSVDAGQRAAMQAPLWFLGRGIREGQLPHDVELDQVAPTLEPLLGLHRPYADVRSGTAIAGVAEDGMTTPLVVLIAWKGIGELDRKLALRRLMHRADVLETPPKPDGGGKLIGVAQAHRYLRGVGTAAGSASAGSLPLDPTAVEATIGTGGLPAEHGITGTKLRGEAGTVDRSFRSASSGSVIATLGDDLDETTGGRALIGLIGETSDLGLTGDNWYHDGRIVDRMVAPATPVGSQIDPFIGGGWGADDTPDILGVALSGDEGEDERATATIERTVLQAVPSATIVVAGTGSLHAPNAVRAPSPPGTATAAAGGLFVEHDAPAQQLVDGLEASTAPDGAPLFADAFVSYAVRFGSYC